MKRKVALLAVLAAGLLAGCGGGGGVAKSDSFEKDLTMAGIDGWQICIVQSCSPDAMIARTQDLADKIANDAKLSTPDKQQYLIGMHDYATNCGACQDAIQQREDELG